MLCSALWCRRRTCTRSRRSERIFASCNRSRRCCAKFHCQSLRQISIVQYFIQ
ncbi:TPA: hypothetical protein HA253_01455 [Candidatus Woesearchaeota archaeon]|nr:hypothetical protein [Candidatus Woesearchaeota archaeon]